MSEVHKSPKEQGQADDKDRQTSKSYAEILKGFEEIEKIDHDRAAKEPGKDQDSSDDTDKPKTKSYAEILKGFEEIEKIFKQDQKKE